MYICKEKYYQIILKRNNLPLQKSIYMFAYEKALSNYVKQELKEITNKSSIAVKLVEQEYKNIKASKVMEAMKSKINNLSLYL